jgi:hypothetical protein
MIANMESRDVIASIEPSARYSYRLRGSAAELKPVRKPDSQLPYGMRKPDNSDDSNS